MGDRLTKKAIDTASVSDREAYLWDGELKGFGLRIRPTGARSFVYVYRPGGGRAAPKRKVTIGTYGAITLEQAKAKARRLAGDVAHNRDPALEIRAGREAQSVASKTTVSVLVPLFVEQHHRARGNRSADEAGRTLSFDLVKRWPHRSVKEITGPELTRLLRDVAVRRKAPGQARRLYIALSRFFRWCVTEGYCASSPVATVEAPPPGRVRERVISDFEIALMWRAAQTLGYPFGYCVQLLILTGARRNEIAEAKRSEFSLAAETWILPATRSKNKRSHLRHLSPQAVAILNALPQVGDVVRPPAVPRTGRAVRDAVVVADLLFSTTGRTPISGFSKVRDRLQELMVKEAKRLDLPPPADDWQFHDLRRSLVTWLAAAGFAVHVADKLLGHVSGAIRGVAAVYQRHEFLPERRAAMLAWGQHVEDVVRGRPVIGNVVPIRAEST